jgi:hypothetical protein
LKDAQEHVEAPRSTFRESKPPKKFPNFMALRSNVIEDAADHQVYQDAMVQMMCKILCQDQRDNQF